MGKWYNAAYALKQRIDAWQALIRELQDRLAIPIWAELELGAAIAAGDRVRYLLREFECIRAHEKSLLNSPANPIYWKELHR